jgi:hypothetical protein
LKLSPKYRRAGDTRSLSPPEDIDSHSLSSTLPISTIMNFDKKDEDNEAVFHLDKTQVFQEARVFNASPIQPKKCRILLTKIKRILSKRGFH